MYMSNILGYIVYVVIIFLKIIFIKFKMNKMLYIIIKLLFDIF